jgi:hypothetical protein
VIGVTTDPETHKVTITFDDGKTNVETIRKNLAENDYPPE